MLPFKNPRQWRLSLESRKNWVWFQSLLLTCEILWTTSLMPQRLCSLQWCGRMRLTLPHQSTRVPVICPNRLQAAQSQSQFWEALATDNGNSSCSFPLSPEGQYRGQKTPCPAIKSSLSAPQRASAPQFPTPNPGGLFLSFPQCFPWPLIL